MGIFTGALTLPGQLSIDREETPLLKTVVGIGGVGRDAMIRLHCCTVFCCRNMKYECDVEEYRPRPSASPNARPSGPAIFVGTKDATLKAAHIERGIVALQLRNIFHRVDQNSLWIVERSLEVFEYGREDALSWRMPRQNTSCP